MSNASCKIDQVRHSKWIGIGLGDNHMYGRETGVGFSGI
jgi:hypothetical protein